MVKGHFFPLTKETRTKSLVKILGVPWCLGAPSFGGKKFLYNTFTDKKV
jgi:hypothetical protein